MPWSSLLIALALAAPGDDKTAEPGTLRGRCDALFQEYIDAAREWKHAIHKAKTNEEARTFVQPDRDAYALKFLAMAREAPDDPGGGPGAGVRAQDRRRTRFPGPRWSTP